MRISSIHAQKKKAANRSLFGDSYLSILFLLFFLTLMACHVLDNFSLESIFGTLDVEYLACGQYLQILLDVCLLQLGYLDLGLRLFVYKLVPLLLSGLYAFLPFDILACLLVDFPFALLELKVKREEGFCLVRKQFGAGCDECLLLIIMRLLWLIRMEMLKVFQKGQLLYM